MPRGDPCPAIPASPPPHRDKQQLPGFGQERAWDSPRWRQWCKEINLRQVWRCKDPELQKLLDRLRVDRLNPEQVASLCRGRKAWSTDEPAVEDMDRLLKRRPDVAIVTCTRDKAEELNKLAMEALFPAGRPVAELSAEPDVNPANYERGGGFRKDRRPIPSQMEVRIGMRMYLTQNVRKEDDYLNGMLCEVEKFTPNDQGGVLLVRTVTGQRLAVTKWTNNKVPGLPVRHFPVRYGYASTIHKVQGDEFKGGICVVLNKKLMRAAAYTAISRVPKLEDVLLAGSYLEPDHFVPAQWVA